MLLLSALLFILIVEVLATKVRNGSSLQGLQVEQNQIKITQLADDTTLILKDDHEIPEALYIIDAFGNISGLKLNINKTHGLDKGACKNKINNVNGINFTNKIPWNLFWK